MRLLDFQRFRRRIIFERVVLTSGLITFFAMGYFSVGVSRNPANAHVLTTVLDERIPFIAASVWVYLWVFPCALIPLFVVRCSNLFRRTAIAYAAVIVISLVFFAVFPVTAVQLRVPQTKLDASRFSEWAVSLLYSIDPPYNLFPSLHLSLAALAALSVWKASKAYGGMLFVSLGFVAASVCTIKQHCLLDILGGVTLATLVGTAILKPYHTTNSVSPAYSRLGLLMYLAFVATVYTVFWIAFVFSS